jgi:hypothetical protein
LKRNRCGNGRRGRYSFDKVSPADTARLALRASRIIIVLARTHDFFSLVNAAHHVLGTHIGDLGNAINCAPSFNRVNWNLLILPIFVGYFRELNVR